MDCTEKDASNNFSTVACVFAAAATSLPSRCLATIGGYTYRHRPVGGFMKYAAEMASVAVTYTKINKDWLMDSEIHRGLYRHTDSILIA
jgi:hypothetical protein